MKVLHKIFILVVSVISVSSFVSAQSTLDCQLCHSGNQSLWATGPHANSQTDVADELAEEWTGLPADSVILGSEAENCIACHGPISVTANGGMTEVEALNHFFTTTNGLFVDTTHATDTANWPHVGCTTCHDVPANHPTDSPTKALFNSTTVQYMSISNTAVLCGQCHGTLRFADTDHRVFDAWKMSTHGHRGQADVAEELAGEWAGSAPDSVINGSVAEDCIACHAPTSVLVDGGISETEALSRFFSTTAGVFSETTAPTDTANWPEVSCNACHNPHQPDGIYLFDSKTAEYVEMATSQELCGQCHGNLRFADTDHLSYNIEAGTGGTGVENKITMSGVQCVSCHMHADDVDGSNSSMYGGHTWRIFVTEDDGSETASCTGCHSSMDAAAAENQIDSWKDEFAALDSIAQLKVAAADEKMVGNTDPTDIQYIEEAHHNLEFAESDESGGFHNHNYSMALLNDVIEKADLITGINDDEPQIPGKFSLAQNYPNPVQNSLQTTIRYQLAKSGHVTLAVYNLLGQVVQNVLDREQVKGKHSVLLNTAGLANGLYVYKLTSGNHISIKKMLIIK